MGKLISVLHGIYSGILWLKSRFDEFQAIEKLKDFKKKLRQSAKTGNTKEIQDELTRERNDL